MEKHASIAHPVRRTGAEPQELLEELDAFFGFLLVLLAFLQLHWAVFWVTEHLV